MAEDELKRENWELKEENRRLQDKVNRLQQRIDELHGHIEMQRAEIIVLKNRNEKSKELKEIFEPPTRIVKTTKIDNRNTPNYE